MHEAALADQRLESVARYGHILPVLRASVRANGARCSATRPAELPIDPIVQMRFDTADVLAAIGHSHVAELSLLRARMPQRAVTVDEYRDAGRQSICHQAAMIEARCNDPRRE